MPSGAPRNVSVTAISSLLPSHSPPRSTAATPSGTMGRLMLAIRLAIGCAVAIPLAALVLISVDGRDAVQREAEVVIAQRADLAAEHAGRVLEIQETILDHIDLMTRGMSWQAISASDSIARLLRELAEQREHIVSIWMADATGAVRAASVPLRPGQKVDDRDVFIEQRAADRGTFIGAAIVGRTSGLRSFGVSRRRTTADGAFDGTVHVAVSAEYFEDFFTQIPGRRQVAALLRADGVVLARSPALAGPIRLTEASPLMQRIAGADHGVFWGRSTVDGMSRLYAFRRVGTYPLYAGFGADTNAIFAEWRAHTLRYGVLTAVLAAMLVAAGLGLMALARRSGAATARALEEAERNVAAQRTIDALERQNAVSRVVAGVAHEFNNLLTPIMMGAELLKERTEDGEQRRTLTSMIAGAERGARLVADLLSHIQNQFLRIEPVALRPAIDETLALFRAGRRPEVQVTLAAEEGVPQALADRPQFQLALTHLLDNADAALAEGGTIAVRLLGPGAGAEHRHLSVVVQDNGTGMSPDVLAQAREPFFTTAAYRERPGLGLSMVSGFMRQIGGELVIESLPGWGTRAEMRLPVASG
jgi:signal transduction histidine kinase